MVIRLGDLKVLGYKLSYTSSQTVLWLFGLYQKISFLTKKQLWLFGVTFDKFGQIIIPKYGHTGSSSIPSELVMSSVTRLGDFWKLLMTVFHAKAAQIFGGFFENINFQVKTAVSTFWATFNKFGQLFTSPSGRTVNAFSE